MLAIRFLLLPFALTLSFGAPPADLPDPPQSQIEDNIQKFAAKEGEFRRARVRIARAVRPHARRRRNTGSDARCCRTTAQAP